MVCDGYDARRTAALFMRFADTDVHASPRALRSYGVGAAGWIAASAHGSGPFSGHAGGRRCQRSPGWIEHMAGSCCIRGGNGGWCLARFCGVDSARYRSWRRRLGIVAGISRRAAAGHCASARAKFQTNGWRSLRNSLSVRVVPRIRTWSGIAANGSTGFLFHRLHHRNRVHPCVWHCGWRGRVRGTWARHCTTRFGIDNGGRRRMVRLALGGNS